MNKDNDIKVSIMWGISIVFMTLFMLFVLLSLYGCCSAKCVKTVYQPVEVLVPVPVEGPALPVPEPPDCGALPPDGADWRKFAGWSKDCYDTLFKHIEKLTHIIVSYNETRKPAPTQTPQ